LNITLIQRCALCAFPAYSAVKKEISDNLIPSLIAIRFQKLIKITEKHKIVNKY